MGRKEIANRGGVGEGGARDGREEISVGEHFLGLQLRG